VLAKFCIFILLNCALGVSAEAKNERVPTVAKAKKIAAKIHLSHPVTIYCPCRYTGKFVDLTSCGYRVRHNAQRAARLEWEHVVPAEAFGQSFNEWRNGAKACLRKGKPFRGRKCAEKNPEFAKMQADLYNLWPISGELNGLRSNYAMAELGGTGDFGGCQAKIRDRKFEPMAEYKGIVARIYKYMDSTYPEHGVISAKNRKLFDAWDKLYPPTTWECTRASKIRAIQGNRQVSLPLNCGE